MGFSSIRHIPIYITSGETIPVAACSMSKARILIEKHGANFSTINSRSALSVSSSDILKAHIGTHLQMLSHSEANNPDGIIAEQAPVPCHEPMNDREVMEHLVRAANLTAPVQGGLSDHTIAELREIRQRLIDAIPGMTFPRPTSGVTASKMNKMLQIFSQAQADRKLDTLQIIREIQAITW